MNSTDSLACAEVRAGTQTAKSADNIAVRSRVVFVDLLRCVAAFQMLQGHTIAALLAPEHRSGLLFSCWSRARGLTSVAFLFAAGLSFYLATARDYAAHRGSPSSFAKRLRRAFVLIALGYALHFPLLGFIADSAAERARAWRGFLAVDVLQCIGATLLLLELLVRVSPRPERWLARVCGCALLAWIAGLGLPVALLPQALAAYLSPQLGSAFPLAPWSMHMFAGVACGALVLRYPARAGLALGLVGLALLAAAQASLPHVLSDHLGRLGAVCVVSGGLAHGSRALRRLPGLVQFVATESLFLYVVHVVLVYAEPGGLATWVGPRLGPAAAIAAALAVAAGSCAAAWGWARARAWLRTARPSARPDALAAASETR